MKNDLRVRYTRTVIQESFLELLKEKPLNKITVKELCTAAGIHRGTFYKHYQDCYDLMEKIEEQALDELDGLLAGLKGQGFEQGILAVLEALKAHDRLFRLAPLCREDNQLVVRIVRRCYRYMMPLLPVDPALALDEAQRKMSYTYLMGGSAAVIEYWLRSGMEQPPEAVAALLLRLNQSAAAGLAGE